MRDVLVVEDDRSVLRAVSGFCRSEGLQVDETTCVEEAVARMGESAYRLALVDLMLPEESGLDLLGKGSGRSPISTIIITGYATIGNALESFRQGAFDFLPKPFDVGELLGVVRRALRWAERRSSVLPSTTCRSRGGRFSAGTHGPRPTPTAPRRWVRPRPSRVCSAVANRSSCRLWAITSPRAAGWCASRAPRRFIGSGRR